MATLKNTIIDDTGALVLPVGTTAQRPGSPTAGMTRFNTTTGALDIYNGSTWTTPSIGTTAFSPVSISYVTNVNGTAQSATTTYSFGTVSLGSTADKTVLGVANVSGGSTSYVAISVSVGGIPARIIAQHPTSGGLGRLIFFTCDFYDSSATITMTFTVSQQYEAGLGIYNVTNGRPFSAGSLARGVNTNVTVPANSAIIAAAGNIDGSTITWTNLTEDFEMDYINNEFFAAAEAAFTTAQTVSIGYNHTTAGSQSNGYYIVYTT